MDWAKIVRFNSYKICPLHWKWNKIFYILLMRSSNQFWNYELWTFVIFAQNWLFGLIWSKWILCSAKAKEKSSLGKVWTSNKNYFDHCPDHVILTGRQILNTYVFYDLSFASTETKYIKLKTKTQNNIVISGIFHKEWYYYFGFFLKQFDSNTSVYQKISSFGFLVF